MTTMRPIITRLEIRNFRRIKEKTLDVPSGGLVISGRIETGKTTHLRAIEAALLRRGVSADAISHGADKAELLVDVEHPTLSIRRTITRTKTGGDLTVKTPTSGKAGEKEPQTLLKELFGESLDPLALFRAKPDERRKQILEAQPITVTLEDLRRWVPGVPASWPVKGHGLEVVEALHGYVYEKRHAKGQQAKAARSEADQARAAVPAGQTIIALEVPAAVAALEAAQAEATRLQTLAAAANRALAANATQAAKAKDLRLAANERQAVNAERPPTQEQIDGAYEAYLVENQRLLDLQAAVKDAERKREDALRAHNGLIEAKGRHAKKEAEIAALLVRASEIEASITAGAQAPDPADVGLAQEAVNEARAGLERARLAATARMAAARATTLDEAARKLEAEHRGMDGYVRALREDAPRELIARANGIPGLTMDGDVLKLDGVDIEGDGLSGAQRLRFCTEIAMRSTRAGFLLVDELEKLDPDAREVFLRHVAERGFQIIGTCVAAGRPGEPIVVEAISFEPANVGAAPANGTGADDLFGDLS